MFRPFAPLIVPFLQEISGQRIPEGIHTDFKAKGSVVIELEVTFYAIEKLVLAF